MSGSRRNGRTNRDAPEYPIIGGAGVPARLWDSVVAMGIVAATLLAYVPAMRSGYIWDDDSYVINNTLIQGGWDALAKIWNPIPTSTPQYYPLVFSSFWIEHKLWGLTPAGYHIVNVLLHVANALLVWRLARRIGVPVPALVGALFALHPVHVESVAWITERKNVLSGLFYLLALAAYLRFDSVGRWRWYVTCAVLFVAALLSKSVTASLPAVLLLLFAYQRRLTRKQLCAIAPLLVLGAASGLMTAWLERSHVGAEGAEWNYGLMTRATVIAPSAFLFYAMKSAWPHPLMFVYPRWEPHAAEWTAYLPLVAVLLLFAGAAAAARRLGWGPLLLLCFSAGTLFPALGFLNVYPHRYSFVADHFNYLGNLGFIVLYVAAAVRGLSLVRKPLVARAVGRCAAALALAACAVLTYRQCFDYKDVTTLWERTLAKNPDAWIALVNLGEIYRNEGRDAEAEALYRRAERFPPARAAAYGNLALLVLNRRDFDVAIEYMRKSVALVPVGHAERWFVLSRYGWVLAQANRPLEALSVLEESAALAPDRTDPFFFLGQVQLQLDMFAEARRSFVRTIELDPTNLVAFRGAAEAAVQAGDCAAGLEFIERGRRLNAEDASLLYQLVWIRAACADDRLRNGAEALETALRVTQLFGANAESRDAMAVAYAELGQFDRAVYFAREALEAARQFGDTEIIPKIEARLALYLKNQPYRLAKP